MPTKGGGAWVCFGVVYGGGGCGGAGSSSSGGGNGGLYAQES